MSQLKTLTITETHQLLDVLLCKQGTRRKFLRSVRNYTIAMLMLEAGLRVGEVVLLRYDDLFWNKEPVMSIQIRAEISKSKRIREIPVSSRLSNALKEYHQRLVVYNPALRNHYAFITCNDGRSIAKRQIERIIKAAGLEAFGKPVHPHMLRHTFATRLMRLTDIRTVQTLLGHLSVTSTQIYTHPGKDDLKSAIDQMSVNNSKEVTA